MAHPYKLILGSGSPRRKYLLSEAGFTFTVVNPSTDESFSTAMPVGEVAKYLAEKKADSFTLLDSEQVVLTADTVVIIDNKILNKPSDREEAISMLENLSGKTHTVVTGVCIVSVTKKVLFDDATEVTFKKLTKEEIVYYVDTYKPYDKAGAYGAQDFIGMIAIHKIVGSYFNVMGLPIHLVYQHLSHW